MMMGEKLVGLVIWGDGFYCQAVASSSAVSQSHLGSGPGSKFDCEWSWVIRFLQYHSHMSIITTPYFSIFRSIAHIEPEGIGTLESSLPIYLHISARPTSLSTAPIQPLHTPLHPFLHQFAKAKSISSPIPTTSSPPQTPSQRYHRREDAIHTFPKR